MNLERFYSVILDIKGEFDEYNIVEELKNLTSTLEQSINNPAESQSFKTKYEELVQILNGVESNEVTPTQQALLEETDVSKYIGLKLLSRIEKIIKDNQIIPSEALSQLKVLTDEVDDFYISLDRLVSSFETLGIEYEDVKYGEYEVGVSIPKEVLNSELEGLRKEIKELDFAFRTFSEVVGGDASSTKFKTTSSSEWQLFFDSIPEKALCISVAIERIVAVYKNNLEIRKIKQELEEKEIPKDVTKLLEKHLKESIGIELNEIAEELVEKYYKQKDDGRKNELKKKMKKTLRYIADRMGKGGTFEVRTLEPDEPDDDPEENPQAHKKYKKQLAEVRKINLQGRAAIKLLENKEATPILPSNKVEEEREEEEEGEES